MLVRYRSLSATPRAVEILVRRRNAADGDRPQVNVRILGSQQGNGRQIRRHGVHLPGNDLGQVKALKPRQRAPEQFRAPGFPDGLEAKHGRRSRRQLCVDLGGDTFRLFAVRPDSTPNRLMAFPVINPPRLAVGIDRHTADSSPCAPATSWAPRQLHLPVLATCTTCAPGQVADRRKTAASDY